MARTDENRKPMWSWQVSNKPGVTLVLTKVRPWLKSRRGLKADDALIRLENNKGWKGNRTTHCPQGHEYTEENTYLCFTGRGHRSKRCVICRKEASLRYYEQKRLR